MKKILIFNPFGIGDVLFTTPLITALKVQFPDASISYVCNARTTPFMKHDPRLDRLFFYDRGEFIGLYHRSPWQFFLKWKKLVNDLRAERFDLAFDLSLNTGIGWVLLLAGIPRRVGYNYKGRGRFLTDSLPLKRYEGRHVVEYNLDLLGLVGGNIPPSSSYLHTGMFLSLEDERWAAAFMEDNGLKDKMFILLFPGGGASWGGNASFRKWAIEDYVQLAEKLVVRTLAAIVLMGDHADVSLCETMAVKMTGKVVIAAGKTTITQSAALMKHGRCVVMNDGGFMHVAAACGVHPVVIFGPVDERVYGPYPIGEQVVVKKNLPCQPCYRNFRMPACGHQSCLKTLMVDDVFKVVENFLMLKDAAQETSR